MAQMTRMDRDKRQKAFSTLQKFSDRLSKGGGIRIQVTPARALEWCRKALVQELLEPQDLLEIRKAAELLL
jgi:hypothetical protein